MVVHVCTLPYKGTCSAHMNSHIYSHYLRYKKKNQTEAAKKGIKKHTYKQNKDK